jgi:hypothetical protein
MQVYGALYEKHNAVRWPKCYKRLIKMGIERRMQSCQEKLKNLRRAFIHIHKTYTPTKLRLYAMGCPYWDIMCKIWGKSVVFPLF